MALNVNIGCVANLFSRQMHFEKAGDIEHEDRLIAQSKGTRSLITLLSIGTIVNLISYSLINFG